MKYTTFRTFEEHQLDKAFFIFEAKTKDISEIEEDTKELEIKEQKEIQDIFKKLTDNFNKFKLNAGDKAETWIKFVKENLYKDSKTPNNLTEAIKLWDSTYVVGISISEDSKEALTILKSNDTETTEDDTIFKTENTEAITKYREFLSMVKKEIADFKAKKELEKELEKKKEEESRRKEKLGGFLKEE